MDPDQSIKILDILRSERIKLTEIQFLFCSLLQLEKFSNAYELEKMNDDEGEGDSEEQRGNRESDKRMDERREKRELYSYRKSCHYLTYKYMKKERLRVKPEHKKISSVDFGSIERALIFFDVYENRLRQLEQEYDYLIMVEGKEIGVFGQGKLGIENGNGEGEKVMEPISKMFLNEFWEMKKALECHYFINRDFWEKLKYSELLVGKLQ